MSTIDRRALVPAILFGGAATSLALTPGAAQAAMPFDELVPHGPNDLIEKAQVVIVNPRRPRAASGVAGGTEAVASAAGVGFECQTR